MSNPDPSIRVKVDVTNPGQFFACCGLLELADRLWPGAEGWFEESEFCIASEYAPHDGATSSLIASFTSCKINNTMEKSQVDRFSELKKKRKKDLTSLQASEKKQLEKLWRGRPLVLPAPFSLTIDWFIDDHAGGSRFKTWAGQQSVIDIARAMSTASTRLIESSSTSIVDYFSLSSDDGEVPFNFDAHLGPQSSSLDVGYSLDAQAISMRCRPMIELCAFVGLQRFRPLQVGKENRYRYRTWHQPLEVQTASIVACTILARPEAVDYEFRLLYRTKYLKSFLPAAAIGAN